MALRKTKCIGHRPADKNRIRFFEQAINDLDLVRNLCASENDNERPSRIFEFISQKLEFTLHQKASGALPTALCQDTSNSFSGCVSAMSRTKGVVDIYISP